MKIYKSINSVALADGSLKGKRKYVGCEGSCGCCSKSRGNPTQCLATRQKLKELRIYLRISCLCRLWLNGPGWPVSGPELAWTALNPAHDCSY